VTHRRTLARAGAVLAAAGLLIPVTSAPAQARDRKIADEIKITVDDITPSVPKASSDRTPLTVFLTLTNTTNQSIDDISIKGERGNPILGASAQTSLDEALANPALPTSAGLPFRSDPAVQISLGPHQSEKVFFATSTSTIDEPGNDRKGICLCAPAAVYPLFFSAHTLSAGVDQLRGVTATYLPAFDNTDFGAVAPDRVSWIWPLLEPPHRLTDETVFTDDDLAASVAPDGRLSRALDVVEQVAAQSKPAIPMTLLIDPELLDELEVMADNANPYMVATSDGKTAPGVGQADASNWLDGLRTVLQNDPGLQVELTPYGDPDVQALKARGMKWSSTLPSDMVTHVTDALGGRPLTSSLSWPVSGALTTPTLKALVRQGVNTVVLNSTAIRTGTAAGAIGPGLARLAVGPNRDIAAAVLSPAVEQYVASAVTDGGAGTAALPDLLAELAVRAAQEPDVEHAVTLTPPRYVDADVGAAVRTIVDTSSSTFARPISLTEAVGDDLLPTAESHLGRVPPSATHLNVAMSAAIYARGQLSTIRSLLDTSDSAAQAFVASLPIAIQRTESSAWRWPDVAPAADRFASQLRSTVHNITSGVQIVPPTSGSYSYTLASNSAPLPITVDNELQYPVKVRIRIITLLPGFSAEDIGTKSVEATQKHTFEIPTTIEHAGRIQIAAQLLTGRGRGLPLGKPVEMHVRSTALGLIGVIITIVAGVVLGIALLWRLVHRLRQRGASPGGRPPAPAEIAEPEPVG
jgi:hypothetical protein